MPQARDQENDKKVEIDVPLPASTQGDIQVFPEPSPERDMPTPPKLRNRSGGIGEIEILREAETKTTGNTEGHVRITRKIQINLEREQDAAQPSRCRIHACICLGKDGRNRHAQGVGQQDFLGQADNETFQPCHDIRETGMAVLEIGLHILVFHDGSLHQFREKHHIQGKIKKVPVGFHLPVPNIEQIGYALEKDERKTDGDNNLIDGKTGMEKFVEQRNASTEQLEIEEERHVPDNAGHQNQLLGFGCPRFILPRGKQDREKTHPVIPSNQHKQAPKRLDSTPAIKHQRKGHQQKIQDFVFPFEPQTVDARIKQEHHREKQENKCNRIKEHTISLWPPSRACVAAKFFSDHTLSAMETSANSNKTNKFYELSVHYMEFPEIPQTVKHALPSGSDLPSAKQHQTASPGWR